MDTFKLDVLSSGVLFTDKGSGICFIPLSIVHIFVRYHFINYVYLIPEKRFSEFSCCINVNVAIVDNNKAIGTIMTINGYLFIVYAFGGGQSDLSVKDNNMYLFKIYVRSKCILNWSRRYFGISTLISNYSVMRALDPKPFFDNSILV